jgi:hypothetical protein
MASHLPPEGIMVDTEAYPATCKETKDSESSRERAMMSTFAGYFAQDRAWIYFSI